MNGGHNEKDNLDFGDNIQRTGDKRPCAGQGLLLRKNNAPAGEYALYKQWRPLGDR